jgi:hypothetical protein
MVWTVHALRNQAPFSHVAEELRAALAVARIFLGSGIGVEKIEGPNGVTVELAVIEELYGSDGDFSTWNVTIRRRPPQRGAFTEGNSKH